jgi:hypothetical protein
LGRRLLIKDALNLAKKLNKGIKWDMLTN